MTVVILARQQELDACAHVSVIFGYAERAQGFQELAQGLGIVTSERLLQIAFQKSEFVRQPLRPPAPRAVVVERIDEWVMA